QCGATSPAPFEDVLRVNALDFTDVKKFVNEFLRDPFFPKLGGPLAPNLRDSIVENAARELHKNLESVIPKPKRTVEQWTLWPYLRIELPSSEVDRIEQADEARSEEHTSEL